MENSIEVHPKSWSATTAYLSVTFIALGFIFAGFLLGYAVFFMGISIVK